MHIVGELTYLPGPTRRSPIPHLPIPWFIRSPLGFLSDTNVYVSIVRPPQPADTLKPVGEMLVSVINPCIDLIYVRVKKTG